MPGPLHKFRRAYNVKLIHRLSSSPRGDLERGGGDARTGKRRQESKGCSETERSRGIKSGKKKGGLRCVEAAAAVKSGNAAGNSKFPLHRDVVVSIQVFRVNYGAGRLMPDGV